MYDSNNRNFLLKKSTGTIVHIFFRKKYGICWRKLEEGYSWTKPSIILDDAYNDFHADIDSNDSIHIVFQDRKGNINYSIIRGNKRDNTIVLNSKSASPYNKYISMNIQQSTIDLFFIIKHKNDQMLSHQIIRDNKPFNPKVIGYVSEDPRPYSYISDRNNTAVFYQYPDNNLIKLYTKTFDYSKETWYDFAPITEFNGNSSHPKPVMDNSGTIHLCYQKQYRNNYELVYQNRLFNKPDWTPETIIHHSGYPFNEGCAVYVDNKIIIFWVQNNIIYYSSSSDGGNKWSHPQEYIMRRIRDIKCAVFKSNIMYERERIISPEIPVGFTSGLKIAFYNPDISTRKTSSNQFKNTIVNNLNTFKSSIEEINKTIMVMNNKITVLNKEKDNIQKELVKISVKLEGAGNIKSRPVMYEQLESLNKKINKTNLQVKKMNDEISKLKQTEEKKKLSIKHLESKKYKTKETSS